MNDEKIVELFFARDEQAIEETSVKYGKYCYSIAYNILYNAEDAEESVNDTYADAWNCIPPHKPSVLSTFLGKITRRLSIDKYREKNAVKRGGGEISLVLDELEDCISSSKTVEEEYTQMELSKLLNFFVRSLPETERNIFICRYWYIDSIEEICNQFGFSESKVKSMLMRTREKLYKLLVKEGFLS